MLGVVCVRLLYKFESNKNIFKDLYDIDFLLF